MTHARTKFFAPLAALLAIAACGGSDDDGAGAQASDGGAGDAGSAGVAHGGAGTAAGGTPSGDEGGSDGGSGANGDGGAGAGGNGGADGTAGASGVAGKGGKGGKGGSGAGGASGAGGGGASDSREALLAERVGVAAVVTGGNAGPVVHVTNANDAGEGSLREALTGDAPAWVVFDGDFKITLQSTVAVGSNKTVDGRGHHVAISTGGGRGTGGRITGFELDHTTNVIFENLVLSGFGDPDLTPANNPADAIHLLTADTVWVDHCDLSVAGDKLISVVSGTQRVTISFCHFHDQEQNIQIGSQSTADGGDAQQTVTIADNYFDGNNLVPTDPKASTYQNSGYRHPAMSHGRVHMVNNFVEHWSAYGSRSERSGRLFLENNIYANAPDGNGQATKVWPQGVPDGGPPAGTNCAAGQTCASPYKNVCGCNDDCSQCDPSPGFLKASGNLTLGGAKVVENDPDQVETTLIMSPDFAYTYTAAPANSDLQTFLTTHAGLRPGS